MNQPGLAGNTTYFLSVGNINTGPIVYLGANLALNTQACFLAGTRIATPSGDVAVEYLHEDDLVLTAVGEAKPVRWIGYRHVVAAELPNATLFAPVVIERNAIAPGKPARDLWVTPDHAILVEGKLIPAKLLVNGGSIRQVPRAEYSYYHLELDQHDLLLADGLEAESYLDVEAARQRFANAAVSDLVPDMTITEVTERAYAERGVLPLSLRAEEVKPVWDAVAARAATLAEAAKETVTETTADPALHLLAGGVAVRPSRVEGSRYLFRIAADVASVTIASRHTSPWASKPWIDDRRELGVAVASITVMSDAGIAEIPLERTAGLSGWYAMERGSDGVGWCWTNGAAALLLPAACGPRWLEVVLHGTMSYPVARDEMIPLAEAV
jgi:hypothetical protein